VKLVTMQFLTLDGVYQGPGSPDEDRTDGFERGGWLVPFVDAAFEALVVDWTAEADCFLFGRRTYEAFAGFWPGVTDPADRNAAQLNTRPKFVVANKPVETGWGPVELLRGEPMARIAEIKARPGRDLQVHGSGRLAGSLIAAGLVDEVRLVIAPVVVGSGRRLFPDLAMPQRFTLAEQAQTPGGLTVLRLVPAGGVASGTYNRADWV
jgi:dihydrofolate reductase